MRSLLRKLKRVNLFQWFLIGALLADLIRRRVIWSLLDLVAIAFVAWMIKTDKDEGTPPWGLQ